MSSTDSPSPQDPDEAWEAIVEQLRSQGRGAGDLTPWPEAEDVPSGGFLSPREIRPAAPDDDYDPIGDMLDGPEADTGFTPPVAPRVRMDKRTAICWMGLAGGPLVLLIGSATSTHVPRWLLVSLLAACAAGLIGLVSESPRDPGDDGAVL